MTYKRLFPVILCMFVGLALLTTGCHNSPLEQAVQQALIKQDTTQARFDSICAIITANPDRYGAYLDKDGNVDVAKLAELVERIGGNLRPPMHWDLNKYLAKQLSLTVYFERSGSMVPYDSPGGRGQLKKAVNDLINSFPDQAVNINIVNDDIYPYHGSIDAFLQDRDIYASTQGMGDASLTDFKRIFDKVLDAQRPGNVSVVVTDLIYSPAGTKQVSAEKIFNEEQSLATSIFKRYKGKSIVVHQMMGDYNGKYYPLNAAPFNYTGQRPFYLVIIADSGVMDAMSASRDYAGVLHPAAARNSYRFNQAEAAVDFCVVPDWKDNAGRFRIDRKQPSKIIKCEGDKTTGQMRFSVAVDLSALQKDAAFLNSANNYVVKSHSGFTMTVQPIDESMITGNNKAYLTDKTHLLTFTGKMAGPRDEITISLPNEMPAWIAQSSATDDSSAALPAFGTTTLGLSSFLGGLQQAFGGDSGKYTTITIQLEQ